MFRYTRLIASSYLFAACVVIPPAHGSDYSFDVRGLVGVYFDSTTHRQIELDLGMSFSQIDAVSLRLTGDFTPGIYGDLNSPGQFPYPAELLGYFPEAQPTLTTAFDVLRSGPAGPLDEVFDFQNLRDHQSEPDFSPLLDGRATFDFAAHGAALLAIYYIESSPIVAIDSATLIIRGHGATEAPWLLGDFNRDGQVDDADYMVWKEAAGDSSDLRADGNGDGTVDSADYTIWRDGLGAYTAARAASTGGVPEPGSSLLASLAMFAAAMLGNRRRSPTA